MGPPSGSGACVSHGITAVAPWRDQVAEQALPKSRARSRRQRVRVTGLCRGGMFTAADAVAALAAIDDNRRAIDEAATLGADCLVCRRRLGGLRATGSRDIAGAPHDGRSRGSRDPAASPRGGSAARHRAAPPGLRRRPLGPQHASAGARPLRRAHPARALGVVIDAYHVWWDPELAREIARAGAGGKVCRPPHLRLAGADARSLLDRGMMGEGVIEQKKIRGWVEAAGYTGFAGVEIFSDRWWSAPADEVLDTCVARYQSVV